MLVNREVCIGMGTSGGEFGVRTGMGAPHSTQDRLSNVWSLCEGKRAKRSCRQKVRDNPEKDGKQLGEQGQAAENEGSR